MKMVIRRKSSIYKKLYESNGQTSMFGHDNLLFKTVIYLKLKNLEIYVLNLN